MRTIENISDEEIQNIQDFNERFMHDVYFGISSSDNVEYDMKEDDNMIDDFETCYECNKIVSNNSESDRVESTLGMFCSNKCYGKYVLDDEQFKELYPDD